jgi:hypothetical protein
MRSMKYVLSCLGCMLVVLSAAGCKAPGSPPTGSPAQYGEVVIDTFNPTGPGNGFQYIVVDLFDSSGVTLSQDPWTSPGANALAVDGQNGTGSNTGDQALYAFIDYRPATPLPSGTVLYARVRSFDKAALGAQPYAIRVLSSPSGTYSYFGSTNATDTPYGTTDGTPAFGAVPTSPAPISLGGSLNKALQSGADVDWIKITLP